MPKDWDTGKERPPRTELETLRSVRDSDQRFFLRMYLRSNIEKDQDEARKRCEAFGVDFIKARTEARMS